MTKMLSQTVLLAAILLPQIACGGNLDASNAPAKSTLSNLIAASAQDEGESGSLDESRRDDVRQSGIWTNPGVVTPVIAGIFSLALVIIQSIFNRHLLWQKQTELEVKRVQNLLDTFYGPFKTLKKANKNLEELLKLESTAEEPQRGQWRTLERLLEGYEFSENQKALIAMILEVNGQLDDLIEAKCGLITNAELQEKVCSFRAHYRVIRAASEGKLHGEFWRFKDYVYPRGLDDLIDREAEQLRRQLASLQNVKQ